MTVGWPLSSGLLRPAQVIFGDVLKNKEMFLLCQGWSHLVLGEPEDILSGHAWTVYTVLKTVSVSTTYSAQSRKCPATSQPRFTAGFSALPTAASVLSVYPSGTRLEISYDRLKAAGRFESSVLCVVPPFQTVIL